MFGSIGMPELIIILVIALIIFGPRKLPELGRSLGKSLGEFKRASNELRSTLEEEIRIEETREQRAKVAAEQKSAVQEPAVTTATPGPLATPPPTTHPEPVATYAEPVATHAEPVATHSEPVATYDEPVATQPEPVAQEPASDEQLTRTPGTPA